MPVIQSTYKSNFFFKNRHVHTVFACFVRNMPKVPYVRERIVTPDEDFLDLDWIAKDSKKLAIISHGLEGSSRSKYVFGMVSNLYKAGIDCVAWNFRGCSGEANKKLKSYHSGTTDDLETVINYAISKGKYEEIYLVGFSLGGNVTLKYVGEKGDQIPSVVKKAVAISAPCDLRSAVKSLARKGNIVYMKRFLRQLKRKLKAKKKLFPDALTLRGYRKIKNFMEYDRIYTAPIHGFNSAEEYWDKCSSRQFIPDIRIPTLLLNAKDDPFLGKDCFPYEEAQHSEYFFLETSKHGGHVGFIDFRKKGSYWSEKRTLEFLS